MFAGGLAILLHEGKLRGLVSSRWTLPAAVLALLSANVAAIVFPVLKNVKEIAQAGLMPLMVVSTVYRPGDLVSTVLEWKPFRLIGMWSYSIYLWQQLFITSAIPGSLALKAVLLCGAVFLSYTLVEQPCRRFGRRLLKVRAAAPAAESVVSSSAR
jgi:peptidoglycan/LPS O-acetylase OafA/YrhL